MKGCLSANVLEVLKKNPNHLWTDLCSHELCVLQRDACEIKKVKEIRLSRMASILSTVIRQNTMVLGST